MVISLTPFRLGSPGALLRSWCHLQMSHGWERVPCPQGGPLCGSVGPA